MPGTDTASIAYAHITHTPELFGGEARIEGHRIRVRDVVAARDTGGFTPEEIVATVYPGLTLGQVYAALAYYLGIKGRGFCPNLLLATAAAQHWLSLARHFARSNS